MVLVIPARVIVYFFISLPGPAVRDPLGVLCVSSRSARNIQRRLSTACVNAVDVSPQRRLLRAVQCDSTRFDPPTANNAKDRGQRVPPSFPGGRCRLLVHVSSFFFSVSVHGGATLSASVRHCLACDAAAYFRSGNRAKEQSNETARTRLGERNFEFFAYLPPIAKARHPCARRQAGLNTSLCRSCGAIP